MPAFGTIAGALGEFRQSRAGPCEVRQKRRYHDEENLDRIVDGAGAGFRIDGAGAVLRA